VLGGAATAQRLKCTTTVTSRPELKADSNRCLTGAIQLADRGHESISMAGYILDITGTGVPLAQHFAQEEDVNAQCAFLDDDIGPHSPDQTGLAEKLSRMLEQGEQDLQRTTSQANRLLVLQQHTLSDEESESTECNSATRRRR